MYVINDVDKLRKKIQNIHETANQVADSQINRVVNNH